MKQCDVCGRELKKVIHCYGYKLCSKHMHQYIKYGKFLDNIARTNNDLNDYIIDGDIAKFNLYNQKNEYVNSFIIDKEDINKIKYNKWRVTSFNHIVTGNCTNKNPRRELSRVILDCNDDNYVVDHINGNTLDNRKCNLRICTQAENTYNKTKVKNNTSGFIGVNYSNTRNCWCPEIRKNNIRVHLGRYNNIEDAIYVRYIAEVILFGEYRNINDDSNKNIIFDNIDEDRKNVLYNYTANKLKEKFNI